MAFNFKPLCDYIAMNGIVIVNTVTIAQDGLEHRQMAFRYSCFLVPRIAADGMVVASLACVQGGKGNWQKYGPLSVPLYERTW